MRRQAGFTLTELIMVIVLLAIISIISVRFIQFSAQGALDMANRQKLAMGAGIVSEQLSRELRSALPGSVRISADQRCIEFIPVRAASIYIDLPLTEPVTSFEAVAVSATQTFDDFFVAVYPYGGGSLYSPGSPGVLSAQTATVPAGTGDVTVSFNSGDHQFLEDSPTRRFFLVDQPVTFCQGQGGGAAFLYRYSGYGFNSSIGTGLPTSYSDSGASREVVAAPLEAGSLVFDFQPPTLQRNGVITFEFVMASQDSDESMAVAQEVQVRNVP